MTNERRVFRYPHKVLKYLRRIYDIYLKENNNGHHFWVSVIDLTVSELGPLINRKFKHTNGTYWWIVCVQPQNDKSLKGTLLYLNHEKMNRIMQDESDGVYPFLMRQSITIDNDILEKLRQSYFVNASTPCHPNSIISECFECKQISHNNQCTAICTNNERCKRTAHYTMETVDKSNKSYCWQHYLKLAHSDTPAKTIWEIGMDEFLQPMVRSTQSGDEHYLIYKYTDNVPPRLVRKLPMIASTEFGFGNKKQRFKQGDNTVILDAPVML